MVADLRLRISAVTIGNPHCVVFSMVRRPKCRLTSPVRRRNWRSEWAEAGASAPLLNRTNVQFAQAVDRHTLRIEIWERGAGYTLASGTSFARPQARRSAQAVA